jgi:hypothetical protein
VECIIRGCLDPNIPFNTREKLLPHVTSCLHELIRTYPTLAFHAQSQRLAVGMGKNLDYGSDQVRRPTSPVKKDGTMKPAETGLIVMWDLKTATRIHVWEAHSPWSVSALSFNRNGTSKPMGVIRQKSSPSGQAQQPIPGDLLLVSYSIQDQSVKFWHPQTGFLSALANSFASSFGIGSATNAYSRTSAASAPKGTREGNASTTDGQGLLSTLANGGGMKLYRTFAIDAIDTVKMSAGERSKSVCSNYSATEVEIFSAEEKLSARQVLEQVRFEWTSDRTVVLRRTAPASSLTFTI